MEGIEGMAGRLGRTARFFEIATATGERSGWFFALALLRTRAETRPRRRGGETVCQIEVVLGNPGGWLSTFAAGAVY
jgi:hypothetical protein